MTIAQLIDEYLAVGQATYGWTDNYVASQRSALQAQLLPHLDGVKVDKLTMHQLSTAVSRVRRKCSPGYAQLVCGAFRRAWAYGVDTGKVPEASRGYANLTAGRAPRTQGQTSSYVDPELRPDTASVDRLVDALPAPYDTAALVSAWSGLRWGEVFALEADDIFPDQGTIHVRRQLDGKGSTKLPKYDKKRTTIVPDRIMAPVLERLGQTSSVLFPARESLYVARSNFYSRTFDKARKAAGWPKGRDGKWLWSWHSLRHHFCTELLHAGVPVEDVAMFAGHSSPAVTLATYVGVREGAYDRARDLLNGSDDGAAG